LGGKDLYFPGGKRGRKGGGKTTRTPIRGGGKTTKTKLREGKRGKKK